MLCSNCMMSLVSERESVSNFREEKEREKSKLERERESEKEKEHFKKIFSERKCLKDAYVC